MFYSEQQPLFDDTTPVSDTVPAPVASLTTRLADFLREPIASLVLTDNRSRIVSARRTDAGLALRVHRSFVDAPDAVVVEVAAIALGCRGARRKQALDIVRAHFEQVRPRTPPERRNKRLDPLGCTIDLRSVRDHLARDAFQHSIDVDVTWGRPLPERPRRRRPARTRSIRLGSFDADHTLIRVHRALDHPDVPTFVVEAVMHHEMLHAVVPPQRRGSRRVVHSATFRRLERAYHDHARAERWIARNLDWLLARARGVRPRRRVVAV